MAWFFVMWISTTSGLFTVGPFSDQATCVRGMAEASRRGMVQVSCYEGPACSLSAVAR